MGTVDYQDATFHWQAWGHQTCHGAWPSEKSSDSLMPVVTIFEIGQDCLKFSTPRFKVHTRVMPTVVKKSVFSELNLTYLGNDSR